MLAITCRGVNVSVAALQRVLDCLLDSTGLGPPRPCCGPPQSTRLRPTPTPKVDTHPDQGWVSPPPCSA